MKVLALGIFDEMTRQNQEIEKIVEEFEANITDVKKYTFLIVYVDYGDYEGNGWMLMKD